MSHEFDPSNFIPEVPVVDADFSDIPVNPDVPRQLDTLPDGREVVVIGDPEGCKDFNHPQGDNNLGFQGTCGLVSCEDVLRQFGVEVTEDEIVQFAAENGLCSVSDNPAQCGGTSELTQAIILTEMGVPAHTEVCGSLEDLAAHIENGQGSIVEVNAGVLWNEPSAYGGGMANHAIVVTGVARDPETGEVAGFFINDSGRGLEEDSGRFIDSATMQEAWLAAGGTGVVTDVVR